MVADPEQRRRDAAAAHRAAERRAARWASGTRTAAPYPLDTCLHQLFEAQAERTPRRASAVEFEGQRPDLSRARPPRQPARPPPARPRRRARRPRRPSAWSARSRWSSPCSASSRPAAPTCPLDPAYPGERLAFMLDDTRAPRRCITQARTWPDAVPERRPGDRASTRCLGGQRAPSHASASPAT